MRDEYFLQKVFGKLFADKRNIGQELFEQLFINKFHLVTGIQRNMKNSFMSMILSDFLISMLGKLHLMGSSQSATSATLGFAD